MVNVSVEVVLRSEGEDQHEHHGGGGQEVERDLEDQLQEQQWRRPRDESYERLERLEVAVTEEALL